MASLCVSLGNTSTKEKNWLLLLISVRSSQRLLGRSVRLCSALLRRCSLLASSRSELRSCGTGRSVSFPKSVERPRRYGVESFPSGKSRRRSSFAFLLKGAVMRSFVAAGLVAIFAVALAVVPASSASAVTIAPSPVNVWPPLITASKPAQGAFVDAASLLITQFVKDPAFVAAIAAKRAGAATSTQLAVIATEAATYAAPTTKAAPLLRGVVGGAAPMVALQAGMMVGNGAARLFGFTDSQVCSQQNGVLSAVSALTNGVSCNAWDNKLTQAQRNLDAAATYSAAKQCVTNGLCYQMVGRGPWNTSTFVQYCIARTGAGAAAYSWSLKFANGTTGSSNVSSNAAGGCGSFTPAALFTIGPFDGAASALTGMRLNATEAAANANTGPIEPVTSVPGNPDRQFKCTQYSLQGDLYVGLSEKFTENDPVFKQPVCPALPPGKIPSRTTIEEIGGPQTQPLLDAPVTPEYKQYATTYPQCLGGECLTELFRGPDNCHTLEYACAEWFTDPTKANTYNCKHGGIAVDLSICNYLSPTFKPGARENGTSYGDPQTGITPTVPTSPPAGGTSSAACWPSGWGVFNPYAWVMQPVSCALTAAFRPSPVTASNATGRIDAAVKASPVGTLTALPARLFAMFPVGGSGCKGPPWVFNVPAIGMNSTFYPFDACTEPLAGAASFAKGLMSFAVVMFTILAATRYIGGTIGFLGLGVSVARQDADSPIVRDSK